MTHTRGSSSRTRRVTNKEQTISSIHSPYPPFRRLKVPEQPPGEQTVPPSSKEEEENRGRLRMAKMC